MQRKSRIFPTIYASLAVLLLGTALVAPANAEKSPYDQPDETWITLDGTVKSVLPDSFTLDYGKGMITVEMDDGDRDADAYKLVQGDEVTVSGKVDADFYQSTTIEASSVYVEKLGTHFFASSVDEEDRFSSLWTPLSPSGTSVRGTVTEVRDEELVLNTGWRSLTVEVEEMPYNPLDDEGYQKIEVGDRIKVLGEMDSDFFEGRELVADTIITLYDA